MISGLVRTKVGNVFLYMHWCVFLDFVMLTYFTSLLVQFPLWYFVSGVQCRHASRRGGSQSRCVHCQQNFRSYRRMSRTVSCRKCVSIWFLCFALNWIDWKHVLYLWLLTRGPWINNYIPEDWPRSLMIMLSKISILLLHAQAYGVIMCRWPVKPQVGRYWYAELYQLVKAYRITKFLVSRSQ